MTALPRLTVALAVASIVAAIVAGSAPRAAFGESSACTTASASRSAAPTRVEVWHSLSESDAKALARLARDYERSHPGVRVKLEAKGSPLDTAHEFFNVPTERRPAVVMLPGLAARAAVETGAVAALAPCHTSSPAELDDMLEGALAGAVVDDQQWGVPFGSSGWVLVYDQAAFRRAGLDPTRPPTTLDEITAVSRVLVGSGAARHGLAVSDPTPLAIAAGALGPDGSDSPARRDALIRWEGDSRSTGLTVGIDANTAAPGVNALVTGDAGMAIERTLALPAAVQALRQGQAPALDLGVAPVPSPSGANVPFDSFSWFLAGGTPRGVRNAGWSFVDWLGQPEQQARIGGGTDFFPADGTVTATQPIDRYATEPVLRRAWSVLTGSPPSSPTPAGALQDRELALGIAFWSFFRHNSPVDVALTDAAARFDESDAFYARSPSHYAECAFARPPCIADSELYTVSVDDGAEHAVDRDLTGDTPVYSPDGTRIAFATASPGATESHIVVMNADGTHRVQVTNGSGVDRHPEWSPDGTRLVFQTGDTGFGGDLYVVDVETAATKRLTAGAATDQQPTWSPDGKHIAYASNRGGSFDLWIIDADGSNPTQFVTNGTDDWWPTWSPDGAQLAFMSDRENNIGVYVVNVDGSNEHRLVPQSVSAPAWSPNGRSIAVVDGLSGEVYLVAPDGSSARRLTTSRGGNFTPSWSPDGTRLLVAGIRRG